jgi:hypothetical protein
MKPVCVILVSLFFLTACASIKPNRALPTPYTTETMRSQLTYPALMEGFDADSPLDEAALTPPTGAAQPELTFEGRLELLDEAKSGGIQILSGLEDADATTAHLPEFDFEFVQSGGYLIPMQRGLIITSHPFWNYLLEPGRVWQESGDQGMMRASFPFALIPKNSNAIFNGTMTFLFDGSRVSRVWYQITQETTSSSTANFWGLLKAVYHPQAITGAEQTRASFSLELAERFPTKPIEQLAVDYPGVDISAFSRNVTPEHMTWYGVVANGVNYVGGCKTRFGLYPYCEWMRAPSYSTAKSAFVSVALMRLMQKYGTDVASLLIKDYVPEAASSPGDWSKVTFDNTLDMATGNYSTSSYMVDEEGRIFSEFFGVDTYAEKMKVAFDWPHSAAPGSTWVYRSSDTFIVTTAMQNYLRDKEGAQADLFNFVVDEVYRPIKLGPGFYSILRTSENNWQGNPIGSFGMWWIPDDIAKLTTFLNIDNGTSDGEQILDPELLMSALQKNPNDRGVGRPGGKYNDAFWADMYSTRNGIDCTLYIPYMAGYSGDIVVLLPNGVTYYYFSDNHEFIWDDAVREANKISPLCPTASANISISLP